MLKLKLKLPDDKTRMDRIVALLGTLFLVLTIFFYLPAVVYGPNSYFLSGTFLEHTTFSVGVLAVIFPVAYICLINLPAKLLRIIAPIISFVSIYCFVMGAFVTPFTVDIGVLDGSNKPLETNYSLAALEIGLALALLGTFWFFYDRLVSFAKDLLVIGCILVIGYTGYTVSQGFLQEVDKKSPAFSADEFLQFSENENILVVLLDTLASDYLLALLDEKPSLAQELDGFTFFRDTASVSPTTYMAMPSIFSGQYVEPSRPFKEAYIDLVGKQSFLTAAANNGATVHLLNQMFNCPKQVICGKSSDFLASNGDAIFQDWTLLIDIAVFRILPHAIKPFIYNSGDWYISQAQKEKNPIHVNSFRDNLVMQEFAQRLYVKGTQPQVKFLHLFNTHYPYNVGSECEIVTVDNSSLDLALNAARCGIDRFITILDAMKNNKIYDNTLIALIADHGSHVQYVGPTNADRIDVDESLRFQLREISQDRLQNVPNTFYKAHPIFAIKRPEERGTLKIDSKRAVSLTDTAATVCAYSPLCETVHGIAAFDAPEASARERLFNDYKWRPEFWGAEDLEEHLTKKTIDYSLINGDLYDTTSAERFFFNQTGFRFRGFSPAEEWGRWSSHAEAELKLCFAASREQPVELIFDTRPHLTDKTPSQQVIVRIGNEIVKEQTFEFNKTEKSGTELRILLQPEHLDADGCSLIGFTFPDAVSPKEQTKADKFHQLRLGLGLISLRLE